MVEHAHWLGVVNHPISFTQSAAYSPSAFNPPGKAHATGDDEGYGSDDIGVVSSEDDAGTGCGPEEAQLDVVAKSITAD